MLDGHQFNYLLQTGDICRDEKRAIRNICHDQINYTTIEDLKIIDLKNIIPIGSVEYCKEIMKLLNLKELNPISYPDELQKFLNRKIFIKDINDVPIGWFIKPLSIKSFDGKLKDGSETFQANVYCCPPVKFTFEWRYYILNGKILGKSRYDDYEEEVDAPDSFVKSIIENFTYAPCGYSIDVGLMDDNREFIGTSLVEINDGWALGYYKWGDMTEESYVKLITSRWLEILGVDMA